MNADKKKTLSGVIEDRKWQVAGGVLLVVLGLSLAARAQDAPAGPANEKTIADLRAQVASQQGRIDQLEAKVGVPSTPTGWTWFVIGLVGEGVFFMRFVVQWWASERRGRTVVPMMFWHLSLAGTALVLAYAIFVINPVFILAYSLNIFLYVRNLVIAKRSPALEAVAEKTAE